MKRDYYAILGVATSASAVEIRRAYQRLARQYSPDVNLWEQQARALFEEIGEAYRVLSDPMARALYDRGSGPPSADSVGVTSQARPAGGRRGDDLHVSVQVAFGQAVSGLETEVPVERLSPCITCGATGTARGAIPMPCSHCGGAGTVWRGRVTLESGPCPACAGAGVRVSDPCPPCRGRGVAPSRGTVRVTLPPGIDTGAQFRLPGEGHAGPFGGPRGDLIVIARVHDDPVFTRKGDNLYCEVAVSIIEAVLGARVAVPGVDGELAVAVPPGTQSGQVFRLRGKGMPRLAGGGRGDLYVTVRVRIPRDLDARTQELFRELGRLLPSDRGVPA
ncbi:MAG TPA: J domain-containing protein [Methylomirabilota bacterium]|jgi:molecular chaperone DnaJ|nr:J domain-containing protein [Methylomirabilota bacterium]